MRKLITLLAALTLVAPLMFCGCSGDDGAAGAPGAPGAPGTDGLPGPAGPGALAKETCVTCHGEGKDLAADVVHGIKASDGTMLTSGTVSADVSALAFTPAGDDNNVTVTVTFTFSALNSAGTQVRSAIDLRTGGVDGAAPQYLRFSLGRLIAGQAAAAGGHTPNQWNAYIVNPAGTGSGPYYTQAGAISGTPATGVYTYTFPAGAVNGYDVGVNDNQVHRVAIQVRNPPLSAFFVNGLDPALPAPVGNNTFDWVPSLAAVPTAEYPTRNIVTTAACNQCHDPLAIHGGGRRETQFCVVCHNPTIETAAGGSYDNGTLVKIAHGTHSGLNLGPDFGNWTPSGNNISYPQNVKNCDTCHQGTDGDNWKNVPSKEGCGSCHGYAMFNTGTHAPPVTDADCKSCHGATTGLRPIVAAHADNTATPNNVPAGLDNIVYEISNVTTDNTRNPVVTFRVTKNGVPIVFNTYATPAVDNAIQKKQFVDNGLITGYTGSPSFLVAFAATQDGINPVVDYNNLGNAHTQGQAATVSVAAIFLNDNVAGRIVSGPDNVTGSYTVRLLNDVTRNSTTGVITSTVPVAYPVGATMRAVGLQGRLRTAVGAINRYQTSVVRTVTGDTARREVVDSNSCLECHKVLALHGGNRVNNVQLCVMCHNPNLGVGGAKSVNMKDLVHAVHAGTTSYPPWSNPVGTPSGRGWADITYPGELAHCTKCHIGTSYKADLPDGVLLSTNSEMGLAPAGTDNVVSPTAAACGRCHSSSTSIDHFRLMGGDVGATRAEAAVTAPPTILAPDITP